MSPYYEGLSASFFQDTLSHLQAHQTSLGMITWVAEDLRIMADCLVGKMYSGYQEQVILWLDRYMVDWLQQQIVRNKAEVRE